MTKQTKEIERLQNKIAALSKMPRLSGNVLRQFEKDIKRIQILAKVSPPTNRG